MNTLPKFLFSTHASTVIVALTILISGHSNSMNINVSWYIQQMNHIEFSNIFESYHSAFNWIWTCTKKVDIKEVYQCHDLIKMRNGKSKSSLAELDSNLDRWIEHVYNNCEPTVHNFYKAIISPPSGINKPWIIFGNILVLQTIPTLHAVGLIKSKTKKQPSPVDNDYYLHNNDTVEHAREERDEIDYFSQKISIEKLVVLFIVYLLCLVNHRHST